MQTPVPREQAKLSPGELNAFEALTEQFERVEEHVLDPSLMFYITR